MIELNNVSDLITIIDFRLRKVETVVTETVTKIDI